jgi:hypothetical protein
MQAELDRLGDGGFEELGNMSVKGKAHDAGLSVAVNVKAEAPSANRGGSDLIEEFKGGFVVVVVGQGGAFYAEIVNNKGEGDVAGGTTKQHGSGGLVATARWKVADEAVLGEEAGVFKSGDSFNDVSVNEGLVVTVSLEERGEAEFVKEGGGMVVGVCFEGLCVVCGHVSP